MRRILKFIPFIILIFLLIAFAKNRGASEVRAPVITETTTQSKEEPKLVLLTENGGRVDWYKGKAHNLIAFDAQVDSATRNTELYTIDPDTLEKFCVTCENKDVPKGFIGQPVWHPDGEHIIFQAESSFSNHTIFEHLAWGINNDLWIIKKDGTGAEKIWSTKENEAALHPHFNEKGDKIIFSEKYPTGRKIKLLELLPVGTPGDENQWDGWHIHIADFEISKPGLEKIYNNKNLFENNEGFYETHGFVNDNEIIFSHTADGKGYVDDIYTSNLDGSDLKNLINSPDTWDEHGLYSPNGKYFTFMSSRIDKFWRANKSKPLDLATELYIMDTKTNKTTQLTHMNDNVDLRHVVSDYDWNKDSTKIVFEEGITEDAIFNPKLPKIWILTL